MCLLVAFLLSVSIPILAQTAQHIHAVATNTPLIRDPYVPHVPLRAIVYQRAGDVLALVSIGWSIFGLWLMLRSRLSARLRTAVFHLLKQPAPLPAARPPVRTTIIYYVALSLYYMAFTLLYQCWTLPIGLIDFGLEHHYGFSQQTVGSYLHDSATRLLLGWAFIPVLWCAYGFYHRTPRHWWQWLWALIVILLFGQMVFQPLVVAPIYNRFTPLAPGPLRQQILLLADRAGIGNARILVADTSRRSLHVNAYVTGWGPSTRIVIEDNALRLLPEDQILAMLGHEMGHYVEGHIWILFLGSVAGSGLILWLTARLAPILVRRFGSRYGLTGLTDLAALPLVYLTLYLLLHLQLPLANLESRILEHRADAYGLRLTHLNDATARLFVGFAERDYTDPDPPSLLQWWFGSHPTLASRIAFARDYTDGATPSRRP